MQATDESTLRATVMEMDGYSQSGFNQINAIAKLALQSMESPEAHGNLELIASALETISGLSFDIGNCINVAAENVGCNYVDKPERNRAAAARLALKNAGSQP